ncbi:MAG TPA: Ig-like domain-containing protein, partial [Candidatus Nitrosotenuis sp.]
IASGGLKMTISSDPVIALNGETVNVDFNVLNTGTIPLFIDGSVGVVVDNENCTPVGESQGQITLEPGFDTHFTCTVTATRSPMVFNANATAIDLSDNQITTTAQYTLDVINREITLEISAQPNPTYVGTLTTVTYNVTNIGNTLLTIDGQTGVVESLANCTPFAQNGIVTIQSGEFIAFTCTVTGTISPIEFDATAFALYGNVVIPSNLATFTLNSISHTPTVVSPQSLMTPEDTPFSGSLGITDPDNTTWTITYPSSTLGTLIINTNGTYTFTPNLDVNGFESLTITISDEDNTITVALDITVSPVNDAPVLDPIGPQSGNENTPVTFTATATDIDQPPQPLTFSLTGAPLGASIDPFIGLFSWIPTEAQGPGSYTFDVVVSDGNGDTDTETIIITIGEINTAPISNAGTDQTVNENTLVALAGTGTDSDLPSQPLTFLWTQTGGPTIALSNPNILNPTFTAPSVLTNTILTFTLDVSDGIASSTDTVNVTVQDTSVQLYCGLPESAYSKVVHGTNGNDNLVGTNGNDLIIGNDGNDKIKGKGGNDCLIGGNGNDKIWGGKGNDTIAGNAGDDYLSGQDGNDTITGDAGDDKIWGGKGNDVLDGNEGRDRIHGAQGNDTITSGDGDDKIWGGKDNDTIDAGTGNDRVNANQGDDNVIGGDGNDWLSAGIGNDVVNAGLGDDRIFGMPGNDNLFGEAGNDIIHGGQGNDLLNGGLNDDQCNGAQGTNTFVSCESQKPMNEENEDAEEDEEQEDNDNGNDNNGNHGNDNNGNGKDNKNKKN